MKVKRTLYYDEKAQHFVCIIWDGVIAKHIKVPKDAFTETKAKRYLRENHGIKISAKS